MVICIVEGITDSEFLTDLMKELNVPREQIEFKVFEGKDNIFKTTHKLYDEIEKDLDIIDSIFITLDADDPKDNCPIRGYTETEKAINKLIDTLSFEVNIDYYIFSDTKQEGYLESFLLSVLDDTQTKCVNNFKECFTYELSDKWVYNSFYKHNKHPFDFSHKNFKELKTKLQTLFKEEIQ